MAYHVSKTHNERIGAVGLENYTIYFGRNDTSDGENRLTLTNQKKRRAPIIVKSELGTTVKGIYKINGGIVEFRIKTGDFIKNMSIIHNPFFIIPN